MLLATMPSSALGPGPEALVDSMSAGSVLRRRHTRREQDYDAADAAGPSPQAVHVLAVLEKGIALLHQLRASAAASQDAGSLVEASQWSSSAAQRCRLQAEHTLREVHAALFEVEEELLVPGCSSAAAQGTGASQEGAASCREWLQQLQGFVLAVERRVSALGSPLGGASLCTSCEERWEAEQPRVEAWQREGYASVLGLMAGQLRSAVQMVDAVIAADARQQQQEQQRHQIERPSHSCGGGSAQALWQPLPSQGSWSALGAVGRGAPARLVCPRSRLDYRTYWAGRVSL